ncbi:hemerythrin domain-containing protein [Ovoidimarina sediminis]|uniref:hemerythrin domain-containing protein n=1 Tax=Ovoidimarina sediminis TaxID=3079856 RepID=UPI00290DCC9E|nr:hemerythrin domain-containing protein [Rhodophyticola sp. MJ-SS7]MDU8945091.1 hemerythrin domain-containing protein [Rhodophyticola sp. MJ-SS7]
MTDLHSRTALPPALRVLAETLPRADWEAHANFDGLTRFWMNRHLMFREVLDRMRTGTEARLDQGLDPQRHAAETQRYASFFLNELHGHHMIEDQHYFPQLMRLDKRLEAGFQLLDADHHALDADLHALAETVNGYLQGWSAPDAQDRAGALLTHLQGFGVFLDRHLTDEEDLIVPIILTHAPDMH